MFYKQVHTHVRTSPSGSTMQARFPFHAFTGFSFLMFFFYVDFEASWIGFWRSKFLLFKLKLIFDRFFGPLQNQEGALWGPFCRFREVKIEHPYHTLGVFSILDRFQETSKFH